MSLNRLVAVAPGSRAMTSSIANVSTENSFRPEHPAETNARRGWRDDQMEELKNGSCRYLCGFGSIARDQERGICI